MATTTTAGQNEYLNDKDYINQMYDSSLASQKAQLETDYNQNVSDLDAQQKKAQAQADANLNRTYVEAAKSAKNYAETQNAYGMTSGTLAQAKLAMGNQLQADMTGIRTAQQTVDAEIERERGLLAKEYAAAIAKAQADNDMERAQALYEAAKEDEAALLAKQKEAASMLAQAGDYSLYQTLYGLTDEQVAALTNKYGEADRDKAAAQQKEAAALMAAAGDYSLYQQLYGLTDEQVEALKAEHAKGDQDQMKEAASLMAATGDYSLYKEIYGLTDEQIAALEAAHAAENGKKGSPTPAPNPDTDPDSGPNETDKPMTREDLHTALSTYKDLTTDEAAALITAAVEDGAISKEEQLNYMLIYG